MIIDSIHSFAKYSTYYKGLEKVYDFIKKHDMHRLEPGTYVIEPDDIWCSVVHQPGKGVETLPRLEAHDSFIDVQLLLEGEEMMGFKDRALCNDMTAQYDEQHDMILFEDEPQVFINLGIDNFVIFFPKDAHAPMIGDGMIRKAVFKVRVINN